MKFDPTIDRIAPDEEVTTMGTPYSISAAGVRW